MSARRVGAKISELVRRGRAESDDPQGLRLNWNLRNKPGQKWRAFSLPRKFLNARKDADMRFAIMQWVGKSTKSESVFGVIDETVKKPVLPMLSDNGHWADFRLIDESRFLFAKEAKAAIAENGYYLMGASVTITEAFGKP